jgi:hypothetical protein
MRRRILVTLTLGGLLLLAVHNFSTAETTNQNALVGSWVLTFTPNPATPTSATPIPATQTPVPGLATFTSDKTVIETDTSATALRFTPGHGIWTLGPVVSHWFIQFSNLEANPDGTLEATRVTTLTVELNSLGNKFTGGYSSDLFYATHPLVVTSSGTVTGKLMQIPLLP